MRDRSNFFVGIDATRHETTVAVADEHGNVGAEAVGCGFTPERTVLDEQRRNVLSVLAEALAKASITQDQVSAVTVGIVGAESSSGRERNEAWLSRALAPARCLVECPAVLSLRAATRDAVGVGLIADHRTSCVGRDRYGRRHAVGGHGEISGDVGYARDLAMRALGAAWMAEDGRAGPSSLSTALPESLGVASVQRLPELLDEGELPASVVEQAVDCLFEQALLGDGLAEKIIEDTGGRLGATVVAALRQLSLRAANAVVVLDGAMFTRPDHADLLRATRQRILSAVNEAHVMVSETPRVLGAVLFARDLMDHAPLAFADRIRQQAPTLGVAPISRPTPSRGEPWLEDARSATRDLG